MSPRPITTSRPIRFLGGGGRGVVAGLAGVAMMTVGEKLEQAITHRPKSYVPGGTLKTLLGQRPGDSDQSGAWNHARYWGTGATVGALRGRSQPRVPPRPPNEKAPQC